ncbi:C3 and PZP-like alpha-2-macroglobulin domain-containing protein 8 [Branchiostoma lanceolatum]|uniref:C3 and PZP-like alpha-2-macroglobulin domain-containing protein 8 n=1 Tax=Branchiostoma lanceolatum TaxID=7740 RepID=UPI003453F5F0
MYSGFLLVNTLASVVTSLPAPTSQDLAYNTNLLHLMEHIFFHPDICQERSTDSTYRYRWDLKGIAPSPLTFEARARNDVRIGLSAEDRDLDYMYEIVIGGDGNTRSFIRRDVGARLVEVDTPGILSDTEFRGFWIGGSVDGTISVGKQGEQTPFMQWTDPHPLPVIYVGYTTAYGSTGDFKFSC